MKGAAVERVEGAAGDLWHVFRGFTVGGRIRRVTLKVRLHQSAHVSVGLSGHGLLPVINLSRIEPGRVRERCEWWLNSHPAVFDDSGALTVKLAGEWDSLGRFLRELV